MVLWHGFNRPLLENAHYAFIHLKFNPKVTPEKNDKLPYTSYVPYPFINPHIGSPIPPCARKFTEACKFPDSFDWLMSSEHAGAEHIFITGIFSTHFGRPSDILNFQKYSGP